MRVMLAKVEVQRVLILAFAFCMLAGAVAGVPFEMIVLLATVATAWTFLLGWSLTLHSALARGVRVAVGAGVAAGCAAVFSASAPGVAAVALVAAGLLAGAEYAMRRGVAA